MKTKLSVVWMSLFFGIILIAPVTYFVFYGNFDTANYENRKLYEKPELKINTIHEYASDYELFFNDRIPFRNYLTRANSAITYFLFHESVDSRVIVGDDHWLFYNGQAGIAISQYKGEKLYTNEELEKIADNMVKTKNYLAERNCEFILLITPNKERIYGEDYLPDQYGGLQPCNTEQIITYLRENTDINVVWAGEAIEKYKEKNSEIALYCHLDTHWSNVGAYIGSSELLSALGIEIAPVEALQLTQTTNSGYDLANFMNLKKILANNEINYEISGYPVEGIKIINDDWPTEFRYNNVGKDERKLFVVRDSFFTAMRYIVGSQFNDSIMTRNDYFKKEMVDIEKPDIFVYETVERYDERLLTFVLTDD